MFIVKTGWSGEEVFVGPFPTRADVVAWMRSRNRAGVVMELCAPDQQPGPQHSMRFRPSPSFRDD